MIKENLVRIIGALVFVAATAVGIVSLIHELS